MLLTLAALGLAALVSAVVQCATEPRSDRTVAAAAAGEVAASPPPRGGVQPRPVNVAGLGRFDARVVDDDGAPVGGGTVAVSCLQRDGRAGPVAGGAQRLPDDGVFEAPACPGTVCIELRHATHVRRDVWTAQRDERVTLVAVPRPRLWGDVLTEAGDPVVSATVLFATGGASTAALPLVAARTSTDADGTFSVGVDVAPACDPCAAALGCTPPPPAPESVVISVRAEGLGPTAVEVALADVSEDEPVTIVMRPAASPIGGVVTDADGEPLPRAFVLARASERPTEQHRGDAADGRFELDGLGDGPYGLRAIQDGVEFATAQAVQPGTEVQLRAVADAAPRDLVVEIVAEGEPLVGVSVGGGPFARATTDSSGQVRARRVLPGTYMLRVDGRAAGRPDSYGTARVVLEPDAVLAGEVRTVVVDVGDLKRR